MIYRREPAGQPETGQGTGRHGPGHGTGQETRTPGYLGDKDSQDSPGHETARTGGADRQTRQPDPTPTPGRGPLFDVRTPAPCRYQAPYPGKGDALSHPCPPTQLPRYRGSLARSFTDQATRAFASLCDSGLATSLSERTVMLHRYPQGALKGCY